jgi:cytochrome oxidase Cu insertion factor (SCO1/SenC/PrrC family)
MSALKKTSHNRHGIWIIILLLMLFIGPMIAAWSLYSSDNRWLLTATVNSGELLQPPLDFTQLSLRDSRGALLPAANFREKWLLLYVAPAPCAAACEKNLYKMQQIWLALGKDKERVQRLLVIFSADHSSASVADYLQAAQDNYPGMLYAATSKKEFTRFFTIPGWHGFALQQGAIYLVDPHSNILMVYPADVKPKGLWQDLTRLLNASQIG